MDTEIRVGQGFDVHAFAPETTDEPLHLACLDWPDHPRLVGHSDGDVVAHAVCDALLSAAGLGDLGTIFGVGEPRWDGASGATLLTEVFRLISEGGWRINNVSVQMVGQKPRVSPRKDEASRTLSTVLGGAPVSFSASTTDHLGFLGREEGLAAIATALLLRP